MLMGQGLGYKGVIALGVFMKFFNDLLSRAPFTLLGMMGLFSIAGNFMTLEENIYQTLEAWRSVTRPIWDDI